VHESGETHTAPTEIDEPSGARQTVGLPPSPQRGSRLATHDAGCPGIEHVQRRQKFAVSTVAPTGTGVPSGARHAGGGGGIGQSDRVAHESEPLMSQRHSVHPSGELQLAPIGTLLPSGATHIGGGGSFTSRHARPVHPSTPPGPQKHVLQPSKKLSPMPITLPPGPRQPPPSGIVASG
jgi:hypothetical protein